MFKKILVPTDGSEYSRRALLMALEIASKLHSEIILLHVVVTPEALGYVLSHDATVIQQQVSVNSEAVFNATCMDIDLAGVKLIKKHQPGYPATEILNEIVKEDIDLIIMGVHGYGMIAGSLMGSVSQKVLTKTTQPILFVK